MLRVKCPNCGTEFESSTNTNGRIVDPSKLNGVGYLIPKEIHNDNLIQRDSKGRFVKSSNITTEYESNNTTEYTTEYNNNLSNTKENNTMANQNNNGANNNFGGMNMNNLFANGFDMSMLAKLVAQEMKNEISAVSSTNVPEAINTISDEIVVSSWAKTSKFYGQKLCGYAYNPYLVRRFLPAKFEHMMDKYELNVDEGIRNEYTYMDGIKYMIKECNKLAMLKRKDKIAFNERKHFWSVDDMRTIFIEYVNNCEAYINTLLKGYNRKGCINVKGRGVYKVTSKEIINRHQVEKVWNLVDDSLIKELELLKNDLKSYRSYSEIGKRMAAFKLFKLEHSMHRIKRYDYYSRKYICKYVPNRNGFKHSEKFVEGFKKSGAFYTAKNHIMFDERFMFEGKVGREAVIYLTSIIDQPAYIIYAKLKDAFKLNNIELLSFNK